MTNNRWQNWLASRRCDENFPRACAFVAQKNAIQDKPEDIALIMSKSLMEVECALDLGANPNAMDGFFVRLLLARRSHFFGDRVLAFEKLIDAGFDVRAVNDDGSSALHECEIPDLAQALLDAGCSTHRAYGAHSDPLWNALQNNNYDVADVLVRHGCRLNLEKSGLGSVSFLLKNILQKPHVWHHGLVDHLVDEMLFFPSNFFSTPHIRQMILFAVLYRNAHTSYVHDQKDLRQGLEKNNNASLKNVTAWLDRLATASGLDPDVQWRDAEHDQKIWSLLHLDQHDWNSTAFLNAGPLPTPPPQKPINAMAGFFVYPATWFFYQHIQHLYPDETHDPETYRHNLAVHLHEAIRIGNMDLIKFLIQHCPRDLLTKPISKDQTALHLAIGAHHPAIAQFIVDQFTDEERRQAFNQHNPSLAQSIFEQALRGASAWRASFAYQPDWVMARLLDWGAHLDGVGQPPPPLNAATLSGLECNLAEELAVEMSTTWSTQEIVQSLEKLSFDGLGGTHHECNPNGSEKDSEGRSSSRRKI